MKLCTTGFLAGIAGVYDASYVYKEIVRFLGGRKLYNSEMSHQPSGGIRIARPQSQQGESVSVNADKLAPNGGESFLCGMERPPLYFFCPAIQRF